MIKHKLLAAIAVLSTAFSTPAQADMTELGNVLMVATPAYALYKANEDYGLDGLQACGEAIGLTAIKTHTLKYVLDAPRPNGNGRGMPSGHTSSAAVGFGCMLGQEGWSPTTFTLGAASLLTGYTRVEGNYHTWGQVAAGFALGSVVGYYATKNLKSGGRIGYTMDLSGNHLFHFTMPLD